VPRRPEEKRRRADESAKIADYEAKKYAAILGPVVEAAKRYEAGEIDWHEFDSVIHGYTLVSQHVWSVLQRQNRRALLQMIEAEARGEDEWDPTTVFEYRREKRMSKAAQRAWPKLEKAVAKLTDAAIAAGRLDLVHDADEWYEMVVAHMQANDGAGFFAGALGNSAAGETIEHVNRWLELIQEIWNLVPQPDRGDKTAYELLAEGRRPPAPD
jgi:hypothetical protein